jgi:hypothetical protein
VVLKLGSFPIIANAHPKAQKVVLKIYLQDLETVYRLIERF